MESQSYTAAEIALAAGVVKSTILRRAEKERWKFEVGGNKAKKFIVASLPPDIQQAMIRKKYNRTEPLDPERLDMSSSTCLAAEGPTPQELAEHFKINIPPEKLLDPKYQAIVRMVVRCLSIPVDAKNRNAQIKDIADFHGYNPATAYRYLQRVKKGEPIAKSTKNYGASFADLGITLRAWDERAGRMAIEQIIGNKRRHQDGLTLYTVIKDTAEAENLRIGTYASFMQLKRKITPALKTFRDKGRQGLRQDIIPGIRRDATAYRPMEWLIGDQHKADYYAIDANGKVATLELFCWLDFRTQMVWGAMAYKHYNRYTVGQALTNAVRWGLPSVCYTDQGKPEKSKYITQLIEQLTGLGIKTEIHHILAEGRHPQAKPIEGFFGIFDRRLKNAAIPGYCKRLKDSRESELQEKELKQLIKTDGLLSIPDLTASVIAELSRWNEHLFKNRNEDNGRSPLDIYTEEIKRFPVSTLSDDTLDYIFLPKRDCLIKRSSVNFRHEWLGKQVYYDRALADYQGYMAEVRYDPFDPSHVWIFVERKLICEAEEWGMINPKISAQVEEKRAEQKALATQIKTLYQKYLPPKAPVRRINRHEREARDIKKVTELRVMRTTLESDALEVQPAFAKASAGKGSGLTAVGNDPLTEFRKQFHPGARKPTEEKEYKPLFKLSMKENYDGDE